MDSISYVTYDAEGNLTGAYLQALLPVHADSHIEVSGELRLSWCAYRANEARDGLELLPPVASPAPSEPQVVVAYMAAVQKHMDARAVTFGYDNLISVITYAEEPAVARYQVEGQAFRAWRSACWFACEQMLAAVKAGDRTAPTHAELIAELPALALPDPMAIAT